MRKKLALLLIILFIIFGAFCVYQKYKNHNQKKKFTFWSIQLKPVYEKQMLRIIGEFEKKHPDYEFVWIDIPVQEAQKRTLASILSSTPPDLINLNPDFSILLAQRNALEFFNKDNLGQFHENLLNKLKYDNKIYALPFYATSPLSVYNKEAFSKCGINSFPKTYDELYNISAQLKKCSGAASFAASLNENDTLAKILNKYGVYSLNSEGELEKAKKVYSMFDDMYQKGYLPKDVLSINHREVVEKYMSNQVLSVVIGSNFINMIKQNAPDTYAKSAIALQLTSLNGKNDVSLMNLIIPKQAANKQLAMEFALLLTNKENQLELAKITNVLPANKYALQDAYFSTCSSDIVEASRCVSAKQLENIELKDFGDKNKKEINELLNKALEQTLLSGKKDAIVSFRKKLFNLQNNN